MSIWYSLFSKYDLETTLFRKAFAAFEHLNSWLLSQTLAPSCVYRLDICLTRDRHYRFSIVSIHHNHHRKMSTEISSQPIGVAAALASATPTRTALSTFSLVGRVALVTGGHRGIGLEIALALVEAGAVVYCLDLPKTPDENWLKVQRYASQLPSLGTSSQGKSLNGRLEYISADVTNQTMMWAIAEDIAKLEARLDICVANAGILKSAECLDYPADEFQQVCFIQVPL